MKGWEKIIHSTLEKHQTPFKQVLHFFHQLFGWLLCLGYINSTLPQVQQPF